MNFHNVCCLLGNWFQNQQFIDILNKFDPFRSPKPKFICIPLFENCHVYSVIVHIEPSEKRTEIVWFDSEEKPQTEPIGLENILKFVVDAATLLGKP